MSVDGFQVKFLMAGPGKRGLGKKPTKTFEPCTRSSPRRTQRTPTRTTSGFHLEDEAEEAEQVLTPRRSSRLVQAKRALYLGNESSDVHGQGRAESGQPSNDEQAGEGADQPSQEEPQDTVTTSKRGRTRNVGLANKRRAKIILAVEFDVICKRIVGKNAQDFISELGCVGRKMARFNKPNYASQDGKLKEEIIQNASEGFVYEDGPLARQCINKQLANQFKSHKHALHLTFLEFSSKEEALQHVPIDVREEDWIFLCNHFDSKEYKDMCARNAGNRKKVKIPSTTGTKSIARMIEEKKRKDGVEVNPIDAYKMSHYSTKKGAMINHEAEKTLEKLVTIQATTDLSPVQICVQELNGIPGQLRGRSTSNKQILAMEKVREETENERQRADEAEQNTNALVVEINAQKEEIIAQKEEIKQLKELHMQSNEKMEEMMNQIALLGRMQAEKN